MGHKRLRVVAMIALLVAGCGGTDSSASTTLVSPPSTTVTSSTSVPDTTTTTLDPRSLEAILSGVDTDPASRPSITAEVVIGPSDDTIAAAITADIEAAVGRPVEGFLDLWVFPVVGSDEILLVVAIPTDVDDEEVADVSGDLLGAIVGAPAASAAGVTMLVMLMSGADDLGPFELTIAIPWADARAAVIDGADVTERVGVQITRNGQVVSQ